MTCRISAQIAGYAVTHETLVADESVPCGDCAEAVLEAAGVE